MYASDTTDGFLKRSRRVRSQHLVRLVAVNKLDAIGLPLDTRATLVVGSAERLMRHMAANKIHADFILTSPPYNLGKSYESKLALDEYVRWQRLIVNLAASCLSTNGSICWQVGNFASNGQIVPLDVLLHPLFVRRGFKLRNRIVWKYGHGLHAKRRFSGRYEVVLWYSRNENYYFDLDSVRIPSKYPGKRFYKGPNAGEISSNPRGKNPEDFWELEADVWSIPNVKGGHVEKTIHPCQFPIGLAERLILALCPTDGLVLDPFSGVGTAGAAALLHDRRFVGSETNLDYIQIGRERIVAAGKRTLRYRPHDKPIYDHTRSPLSRIPDGRKPRRMSPRRDNGGRR